MTSKSISITENDIALERRLLANRYPNGQMPHNSRSLDRVLEINAVHREALDGLLRFNILLVHGVLIATGGCGYLICAPSGIGKSTRAAIWEKAIPNPLIVNGDKPLLTVTDTGATSFGTSWCGKAHWNTNTHVPLEAILFLEQTKKLRCSRRGTG